MKQSYRSAFQDIGDGYYETDLSGSFTYVNDSLCQIFGYPREELIGMNYRQYSGKGDADRLSRWFNKVYRTGEFGRRYEYEIERKDGTKSSIEASASLRKDSSEKPVGFRGIIRDITARKRAEEALQESENKFRSLIENSIVGAYLIQDGVFKYVNARFAEIHGYRIEEIVDRMGTREAIFPEDLEMVDRNIHKRINGEEESVHYEFRIVTKDQEIRNVEIFGSRTLYQGRPAVVGTLLDVTEKKKLEEQMLQSEKLRAVGEMASGVAHDFSNALAKILGNTQLMLYSVKDPEFKEALQVIEKVAKNSAQTVRRLKDFTQRGTYQELSKVDVNPIIMDAIEITRPRWRDEAQTKGIEIEMVSDLKDVPPISGSELELKEVVTSIIFNAIEAMPRGGRIKIRTYQKRDKDHIEISDTGIGIREEVRKKIFEPFFTTKPFSNTGLGLSMSYGIIKRMEGEIDVESQTGKGTTFIIALPICEAGEETHPERVPSPTV